MIQVTARTVSFQVADEVMRRACLGCGRLGGMRRHGRVSGLAKQQRELQNACMPPAITIRDVPSATRDELAARAARSGRSLQEYLLAEINELAARPDPSDVIARARERLRSTGTRVDVEVILAARDAERP